MENNQKRNIFILTSLAFLGSLGFGFIRIIIPIYVRYLGATGLQVGLLSSGFMLARAFAAVLFGKRSDVKGKRRLYIRTGLSLIVVILLLYPVIPNYYWILLMRLLQGFLSGLTWPIAQTMLLESAHETKRATWLSIYFVSGRVGTIFANLSLGALIYLLEKNLGITEQSTFNYFFVLAAFLFFVAFLESAGLKELLLHPKEDSKVLETQGRFKVDHLFVFAFIVGLFLGTFNSIFIIYLKEVFNLSTGNVAYALFGAYLISFPFVLSLSLFADRKGVDKVFHVILITIITLSLIIPGIKDLKLLVIMLGLIYAALNSFVPISRATVSRLKRKKSLGENIGKINAFQNLGQIIGPLMAGIIYDTLTNKLFSLTLFGILLFLAYVAWIIHLIAQERKAIHS